MNENNAKGWHGSYSTIGRISAERFHVILMKNEILNEKKPRIKVNKFLFPSDLEEKKNKAKQEEKQVDIFEESYQKEKKEVNNKKYYSCNKYDSNSDLLSSHYFHHKEIEKQIQKQKKK